VHTEKRGVRTHDRDIRAGNRSVHTDDREARTERRENFGAADVCWCGFVLQTSGKVNTIGLVSRNLNNGDNIDFLK